MMKKINEMEEEKDNYLYKKDVYTPDDKSLALDESAITSEILKEDGDMVV